MSHLSISELKNGIYILLSGEPMLILENEFVKPGKGQVFKRIKIRSLKSGRIIYRTFKSGDRLEEADVLKSEAQFSFYDRKHYVFIDSTSFGHYNVPACTLGDNVKWLKANSLYTVLLFNKEIISVIPPNFITFKVIKTELYFKGDNVSGSKTAVLETGVVIKVPSFIQINDCVRVDTRIGVYVSRS